MTKFVVTSGRLLKAKKIESVLCDYINSAQITDTKILDIGCGTGEIIHFFQKNNNEIFAVDIFNQLNDNITIKNFQITTSAKLPFADNSFDVIFSNHVIEHIQDQNTHMSEIHRCLKKDGLCYYTTPNRNFMVEPHHRIPLIHYFGDKIFHKVLKMTGVYEEDLYLLSYRQMKIFFDKYRFNYKEYTATILKNPEKYHLSSKAFKIMPESLLKFMQFLVPNNIFILSKK